MGKLLERYKDLASPETLRHVRKLANHFEGSSLLHVYSGRLPTGVKEMLDRLHHLFGDVGIHHQSTMLTGTEEFFDLVRAAEERFFREPTEGLLKPLMDVYLDTMKQNSRRIYLSATMVVVHGIQPMGLVEHRPDRRPWVWRSHSDLSDSQAGFKAFARRFEGSYGAALFPHATFVPPLTPPVFIVPPSVDPFSDLNRTMTTRQIETVLERLRVPSDKPLVLRFLSKGSSEEIRQAVQAWKGVRGSTRATLVLLCVGMAAPRNGDLGDPDAGPMGGSDGVRLVFLQHGESREMAALGWAAAAVIEDSPSPWPNLHLLDVLWKSKPVLVAEGSRTARFVEECAVEVFRSPEELAWRLSDLLGNKDKARRMGKAGRACVIERYLAPRHLLDYLKLLLYFEKSE